MESMNECSRRVGMLSDEQLGEEALRLTGAVQLSTAQLIVHLAEIGRRKLYLGWGYSSLFVYCTQRLGMSEPQAALRTQVARVCREFPSVLDSLAANRMNLSVAGRIAPHLTIENAEGVVRDCEGMTRREVDDYVVRFRPKREVSSGVQKEPDRSPSIVEFGEAEDTARQTPGPQSENPGPKEPSGSPVVAPRTSRLPNSRVEPASPSRDNFRFAGDRELREKIERLGEVLGVINPLGNLEQVLEVAIDIALEKKDPRRKHERRLKREAKSAAAREAAAEDPPSNSVRPDEATTVESQVDRDSDRDRATPPTRAVPAAVRDRVFHRAEYRCEFTALDGTRCTQRTHLEVEHDHPFAKPGHGPDGPHVESNLRCLCRSHNLWRAEQEFGRDFVSDKIADRRSAG